MKLATLRIIILSLLVGFVGYGLFSQSVTKAQASVEFYVAPDGTASGDGSMARPWDIKTVFEKPPAKIVKGTPTTIWLRGGIYRGFYKSFLAGTATAPIIVRQYPGERAILDGGNSGQADVLTIRGSYTYYWGFEIMSSDPQRQSKFNGSFPDDIVRGRGIMAEGPNNKLINLIIHDAYLGPGAWNTAPNTELYGNISYYNGWEGFSDRGHGHGIYSQNNESERFITDNITFKNFSHGIHVFGSELQYIRNHTVTGNISFDNGELGKEGLAQGRDLLVNGPNSKVIANMTYRSQFNYGEYGGCDSGIMTDNYIAGAALIRKCNPVTMTGNTFTEKPELTSGTTLATNFPNNTVLGTKSGVKTFVRPNKYEPGRANIAVYNWDKKPSVSVDISKIGLKSGDQFAIYDVQCLHCDPVLSCNYSGGSVTLPMNLTKIETPVGNVSRQPVHTDIQFGAFLVLPGKTVINTNPTPTPPAATPTPTPPAEAKANITLTKSANKSTVVSGEIVSYTIVVKNSGTGDATNVNVNDVISSAGQYVAASATPSATYDTVTATLKWNIPTLAAGASQNLTFQVKAR